MAQKQSDSAPSPPSAPATKKAPPPRLGRGLSALFGEAGKELPTNPAALSIGAGSAGGASAVHWVDIATIAPMSAQPRRSFDKKSIDELADSIRQRGVLQPVILRPIEQSADSSSAKKPASTKATQSTAPTYHVVAGERRWRAAQRAGLHQIPALIHTLDDTESLAVALIENIQRQDLNAIEEAQAYRRLRDDYGHRQQDIARLVGKSRSHIANLVRLLELPQAVQDLVVSGALSMGHARALIGYAQAEALAQRIVDEGLPVRKVEDIVRAVRQGSAGHSDSALGDSPPRGQSQGKAKSKATKTADIAALERELEAALGLAVSIDYHSDGHGRLVVSFASLEQCDMLCARLRG